MKKYAIIETTSTYVQGDERSRTHPGHGYPAHTDINETIREFESREKWENWIKNNIDLKYGLPKKFRAIIFQEAKVFPEVTTAITID